MTDQAQQQQMQQQMQQQPQIDPGLVTPSGAGGIITTVASSKGIGYASYTAMLIAIVGVITSFVYARKAFGTPPTGEKLTTAFQTVTAFLIVVSIILLVYTIIVFIQTKETFGVVGKYKKQEQKKYYI